MTALARDGHANAGRRTPNAEWLRADRALPVPAVEPGRFRLGHDGAGLEPAAGPFLRVVELGFRQSPAAGDEAGEGRPARRLTDRVVPKIEAPADVIAVVRERAVRRQAVH